MFYGCKQMARFGAILKKTLEGHQYGYQMKALGLGCKNMLFFFNFRVCLHFREHKQQFFYIFKKC
jgi:hypothetical protein